MKFTHRLYPELVCILLNNTKLIKETIFIPRTFCWKFENSSDVRISSCADSGFEPGEGVLVKLGY